MTNQERDLVILDQKVIALHSRLDKVELQMTNELKAISADIKDILAHQNKSKGWAAAMLLIGSGLGFLIKALIQ